MTTRMCDCPVPDLSNGAAKCACGLYVVAMRAGQPVWERINGGKGEQKPRPQPKPREGNMGNKLSLAEIGRKRRELVLDMLQGGQQDTAAILAELESEGVGFPGRPYPVSSCRVVLKKMQGVKAAADGDGWELGQGDAEPARASNGGGRRKKPTANAKAPRTKSIPAGGLLDQLRERAAMLRSDAEHIEATIRILEVDGV